MSATSTVATFVWLTGLRGPEPQVWHDPPVGVAYLQDQVVARRRLTAAEAQLPLDALARLFPVPSAPLDGPGDPDLTPAAPAAPKPMPPLPAEERATA